jgi:hypothetical protein
MARSLRRVVHDASFAPRPQERWSYRPTDNEEKQKPPPTGSEKTKTTPDPITKKNKNHPRPDQ